LSRRIGGARVDRHAQATLIAPWLFRCIVTSWPQARSQQLDLNQSRTPAARICHLGEATSGRARQQ